MNAKKIITLITAIALMLSFTVVPVGAEITPGAVTLEVVDGTGIVGQDVNVVINATAALKGFKLLLGYDPDCLTYVSATPYNGTITVTEEGTAEEPVLSIERIESEVIRLDDAALVTVTFTALSREDFALLEVDSVTAEFTLAPEYYDIGGGTFENNLYVDGVAAGVANEAITKILGTTVISLPPTAPEVTRVEIFKDELALEEAPMAGDTLVVDYDYDDVNGDDENGTAIQWYADDVAIEGETAAEYVVKGAVIGKAITVGVTPANDAEKGDEGVEAVSEATAAVVANPEEFASIDGEVTIDGTLKVGKTLTAVYEFVPSVNGGEDDSTFAWYRVDEEEVETLIEGATDAEYTLTSDDKDFFIKVVVTPAGDLDTATGEPAEAITADVVKKATRPSGGDIGVGTVLPGVNPEKPGTETPGTETPGTDEPGTETPAVSVENFKDFPKENYTWAYDAVDTLVKSGVIEGKDAESFDPEGTTTNAEFLAMVIRAMGIETEDAAEGEHWATNIVAKATELGLLEHVEALENDTAITREEMFTILYKALVAAEKTIEAGDASEFTDAASISDFAVEATGALVKAGIVNGMGDGTVAPKGTGTRAQVATVIFRAFFN